MAKLGVVCYLFRHSEVLMLDKGIRENDPNSRLYTLPGGKLEPGEDPQERTIKEVFQEAGYHIEKPRFIGSVIFNNEDREFNDWKNPKDYVCFMYDCWNHTGKMKGSDEGQPIWVPRSSVPKKPQHAGDLELWKWVQDGRSFSGVITHKGKELDPSRTYVQFYE